MKKNLMVIMVMVAVGMFLTACGVNPIAGMSPGLKVSNVSMVTVPVPTPTDVSTATLDQKEVIKNLLYESEEAWNEKNTDLFLRLFSEDAQIMVGREQRIVSKAVYVKMFPDAFDKVGTVKYKSLLVKILDAKTAEAEGVAFVSTNQGIILLTKKIRLVNQNDKWLINESMFEIHSRGEELNES